MASYFKKFIPFLKKSLSDEELLKIWENSSKELNNYQNLINQTSDKAKIKTVIEQISKIKIQKLNEVSLLINYLQNLVNIKDCKDKSIFITIEQTNILQSIITNLEFSIKIFNIIGENYFNKNFLFFSQFKMFSYLVHNYLIKDINHKISEIQKNNLNEYLSTFIYDRSTYIKLIEYCFLNLNEERDFIDFLLPDNDNIKYIINFESFSLKFGYYENIFNMRENNLKVNPSLLNIYLNLIIYLSSKSKGNYYLDDTMNIIIEKLNTLNSNDCNLLKNLLDFYSIYLEIFSVSNKILKQKSKRICEFLREEVINTFNYKYLATLSKLSLETFNDIISKLISLIKKNLINLKSIKNLGQLPLIILNTLIYERSPLKITNSYIVHLIEFYEKSPTKINLIFKLIYKFLIENFSDSIQNNLFIYEVLEMNTNIYNTNNLVSDISMHLKFFNILDKQKIKINLLDVLNNLQKLKYKKIDFKDSNIFKVILEYLNKLTRNFKTKTDFKFLDNNLEPVIVLTNYLSNFDKKFLSDILTEYLIINNYKKYILRIILENNYIYSNINQEDLGNLIKLFIQNKDNLRENEIDEYLIDVDEFLKNSNVQNLYDLNLKHKLKNLFRFFQLNKVFHDNQIKVEVLKEFDYENLNLNLNTILEIFLVSKFNIDQIEDIETLICRTNDIYQALAFEKIEYLYNLFLIFFKYQKDKLYLEILNIFVKSKSKLGFSYFEKCLSQIKKSKIDVTNILNEKNLRLKVLEYTENFNIFNDGEFIEKINFNKDKISVKFNLENEDIFTMINIDEKTNCSKIYIETKSDQKRSTITAREFLLKYVEKLNSHFSEENINIPQLNNKKLKYSINPKLKILLEKIKFDYKGKEFKFNTNIDFKCAVYKNLIRLGEINSIEEIIELENFSKISSSNKISDDDLIKILRFLINIYSFENSHLFEKSLLEIREKIHNLSLSSNSIEINSRIVNLISQIIIFNLHNIKYINIYQLEFLNKILPDEYKFDIKNIEVFRLLTKITRNKFNILPFLSQKDFKFLLKDVYLKDHLKNNYNELILNINYFKENLFLGDKSKSYNDNDLSLLQNKYQLIEVFKNISMNNFMNFQNFFSIDNHKFSINCIFLFYLKIITNLPNLACVNPSYCFVIKDIFLLIKHYNISDFELRNLSQEILNLPNLHFIIESHLNIQTLEEKNIGVILRDFITIKILIFEELLNKLDTNKFLAKNYLLLDKFKILKVKKLLIEQGPKNEDEFRLCYEKIEKINDLDQLKVFAEQNLSLRKEMERVYTSEI